MPILECKCGMTMSVSDSATRRRCLRCGKAELTHVWQLGPSAAQPRTARVGMGGRFPLPGSEDHARVRPHVERLSHVCDGSPSTGGMPCETVAVTTDKTVGPAINISAMREWLDWLESRFVSGELTEEAYSREVERVVGAISREFEHRTQGI